MLAHEKCADSKLCAEYQRNVTAMRQDLTESLDAWVVKAYNDKNATFPRKYMRIPENLTILVFFRYGSPMPCICKL